MIAEERKALSISQLTQKIKGLLEMEVGGVWVRGEISGFRPASSGHIYFNLKDDDAVISCALFKNTAQRMLGSKVKLVEGAEVLAFGQISVYPPRGNYQLILQHIEPVGTGALKLAFEELKKKLAKEGLFNPERKRKIPEYPSKIALITSITGAALQDMLNILDRRNSGISILVVPTLVQGDEAAIQIVEAIRSVNKHNLAEVIVLARGGGSSEDLFVFNDESVVRTLADSAIPTISAIGHEIDFTLCDFVADLRAPTPSAAAELVSKNRFELIESLSLIERKLKLLFSSKLNQFRNSLLALENKLISPRERILRIEKVLIDFESRLKQSIQSRVPILRQNIDDLSQRSQWGLEKIFFLRKQNFEILTRQLEALSPLKVLGRGYTLVEDDKTGLLIKSVKKLKKNDEFNLIFKDGKTKARCI